jgi:hypothetical protein
MVFLNTTANVDFVNRYGRVAIDSYFSTKSTIDMNKYWYFVAMVVCIDNMVLYYKGYVTAKELFPVYNAEEKTKRRVPLPDGYEREGFILNVLIINQPEVEKTDYDRWSEKEQAEISVKEEKNV